MRSHNREELAEVHLVGSSPAFPAHSEQSLLCLAPFASFGMRGWREAGPKAWESMKQSTCLRHCGLSPPGQREVSGEAKKGRIASVNLCPLWRGSMAPMMTRTLLCLWCETSIGAYRSDLNYFHNIINNNSGAGGEAGGGHSNRSCLLSD